MNALQVKGKRLDIDSGIRTRARAAKQQEQWQYIPASAKLFALLADILIEAKEGRRLSCFDRCTSSRLDTWLMSPSR